MKSFADRLGAAVRQKRSPLVVGLDPRLAHLPQRLRSGLDASDLQSVATAYGTFCRGVVDAVAPIVAVVKPQAAFFEQLGPPGMAVLAEVIRYATRKGLLVILDGKRNDIGSTAEAYAAAYLGQDSPWAADALTVSPYLGDDSLQPFVRRSESSGSGLFVLVKTSNPGGGQFQDLPAAGRPLYAYVAEHVEQLAAETVGQSGYGAVGAVAGATYPKQLAELRAMMPHALFLVPGFGAQGGGAADVAAAFDSSGGGAIVNSSRGVIFAYEREPYSKRHGQKNWQDAVAAAARDATETLREHTPAGHLA